MTSSNRAKPTVTATINTGTENVQYTINQSINQTCLRIIQYTHTIQYSEYNTHRPETGTLIFAYNNGGVENAGHGNAVHRDGTSSAYMF